MKKFFKRIFVLMMSVLLAFGTFGMLTGCKKKGDSDTFTVWMGSSVNSTIYGDYANNPVMQYSRYLIQFGLAVVATVPILVIFPFFAKYIEKGAVMGGVKE